MTDYSANFLAAYGFDNSSSVFEPDVMLPSQFMLPDEEGLAGGERRLMAALLSDGIEAYIHQATSRATDLYAVARPKVRTDACEWVETPDESYVFSFDNVCECLGINPEYLRLGLLRYIETNRALRASGDGGNTAWKKIRRPRKQ